MNVWKLTGPKCLEMHTEQPTLLDEEFNIKVKIEKILLSKSDFRIYNGDSKVKYPFVMGRNAVGAVSEIFDAERSIMQKMDRVVIEPYISCGTCENCLGGDYGHCEEMRELGYGADGLMQNFINLPASILHKLPDALSDERALFVSYAAMCLNIMDALNLEKGRHVAVFASTKVGIIASQLIGYYQAVPIFISNKTELIDAARELGIFYAFDTNKVDVEKEVKTVTGGRMCKEIVYFSNSTYNLKDVYEIASVNANICIAGYSDRESKISVTQISQKHLSLFGVYNGCGNYPSAINLLVTGTVNVDKLIGEKLNFANLDEEMTKLDADKLTVQSGIITVD